MKTVREIIGKPPIWLTPDHAIDTAIILMRGYGVSALPVVDSGAVVGMAWDPLESTCRHASLSIL